MLVRYRTHCQQNYMNEGYTVLPHPSYKKPRPMCKTQTDGVPKEFYMNRKGSAGWTVTDRRVQEVYSKAEVVHLTSGLLGLGVLFNCHA